MRRVGELAVERDAGAGGAGEEQAVDAGCGGERLAHVGAADAADDALGNAGFVKDWTRNSPVAGVFSDGLKTTALPASSAGTIWPLGRCAGKL